MNRFELEDRLINFSVVTCELTNHLIPSKLTTHLTGQIIRSSTSTALNYAEALSAESTRDFIHKLKIVLKELRETFVCLKIIHQSKSYINEEQLNSIKKENNELISIFVKSTHTLQKK